MRYTRHELKQDKFAESAAEAVHEVVEHRSGIIRIVAVVVVLALLGGGIFWYMNSREEQAADALGQALVTLQRPGGASRHAAAGLDDDLPQRPGAADRRQERLLRRQRPSTAGRARVNTPATWPGSTEEQLGNDAVAEDQLRALSNSRHRELAALAKYALASVYRDEKRDQDAINLLQTLIDKPTVSVPKANAQLALADIYVSAASAGQGQGDLRPDRQGQSEERAGRDCQERTRKA